MPYLIDTSVLINPNRKEKNSDLGPEIIFFLFPSSFESCAHFLEGSDPMGKIEIPTTQAKMNPINYICARSEGDGTYEKVHRTRSSMPVSRSYPIACISCQVLSTTVSDPWPALHANPLTWGASLTCNANPLISLIFYQSLTCEPFRRLCFSGRSRFWCHKQKSTRSWSEET